MDIDQYRVSNDRKIQLEHLSTKQETKLTKTEILQELLPANIEALSELQEKLYAENRRGLLIVLQAMDAAGKDGVIKHVFSGLNPQGASVRAFKQPSAEEQDHDYLWRIQKAVPARGEIGIFNRSHYEEVIVTRVHQLQKQSQLPTELQDDGIWNRRFREISDYERYLVDNGVEVIKFFLHVSKEEQRERLLQRLEEPKKNWKFSIADVNERHYWNEYQHAFEEMLARTSTKEAPWYIIPADRKWFMWYLISEIVLDKLKKMDPKFPPASPEFEAKLAEWRELLKA